MAKKKFIIIDGNALIHRAFHALPPLTTQKGELINAVYGFTSILLKVYKDLKPDYIAATFDLRAPTFRHKEFKEYKATRVKAPQELYDQIPQVKKVVKAFNIPIYEKEGYEADDLVGTLAEKVKGKDIDSYIVTGDLDTLQLVDDDTKVFTLKRGVADTIIYDEKGVKDKYGLKPDQMIDFKALRGDPSDNIPGVRGIGEKGAVTLLKKFGTLEKLYKALEKDTAEAKKLSEKLKKLLLDHKKEAMMSKKLATIVKSVPVDFSLEKVSFKNYNRDQAVALFQEFEFKSLLNKLPKTEEQKNLIFEIPEEEKKGKKTEKKEFNYQLIDTPEKFEKFLTSLKKQKAFTFDTETDNIDPFKAKLLGTSFSWQEGKAFYVPYQEYWYKDLKKIFENPKVEKYGHNLKFDMSALTRAEIYLKGAAFDTMIASYLLNPGSRAHSLDNVVFAELGHEMIPITALIGEKGKNQLTMDQIPQEKVSYYASEDADYTNRLVNLFRKELEKKTIRGLFRKIEMPLVATLFATEKNGVKIDVAYLEKMSLEFEKEIEKLQKNIYKHAGKEFNVSSPVQLKEILFKKLKISTENIRQTKTGFSTAAGELEKMRKEHPIIELISQYREYTKLKNTYLDALPKLVEKESGRVHTSYNQTVTATGRLSSSNPNLQNIPIRTEIGRKIRKAFIAEKGYELVSIDYSQVELRIVASLADDQDMIKIFKRGEDIHKSTAAVINEVPLSKVTPEMRYGAKEVNFGVLYGMGVYGLAERTGIDREAARDFIDKYFSHFEGVWEYVEQTKALARSLGYVETLFGRRRYLPEINSQVVQIRRAAERMAINMPIQGTAADLMKLAMIEVQKKLEAQKGNEKGKIARMILQVHDELVFEIKKDKVRPLAKVIKEIMETVYKLKVPIETEVKAGKNWQEMKELKL